MAALPHEQQVSQRLSILCTTQIDALPPAHAVEEVHSLQMA